MVTAGNSGGGLLSRVGAPLCSNMPYIKDTMPHRSVTLNVPIRWVASSAFTVSLTELPDLNIEITEYRVSDNQF